MSPLAHTVLRFLWGLLGMGAGAVAGAALLESGLLAGLGRVAGPAPLLGGLAGAAGAFLLWGRWAWVRCPACSSKMETAYLGGRNTAFRCPACGRMDRVF